MIMNSVCNMKAILAVAVLAMAAFAGVMIVGDDADAADESLYTVTHSFDGSSIVKKMDANGSFTFSEADEIGLTAPAGYEFETKWKDVKSGAIYSVGESYSFTSNITVEPMLKVSDSYQIVILTDGVVSEKFALDQSTENSHTAEVITADMVKKFFKTVGIKNAISDEGVISIDKAGFRFDGFVKVVDPMPENPAYIKDIDNLAGTDGKEITYMLIFTPVYKVSFIVESASVLETTSDMIEIVDGIAIGDVPVAPSKANYTFVGWYDAAGKPVFAYSQDLKKYSVSSEDFKIVEDTTLYAKFVPANMTVTFQIGEETVTQTVLYGAKAMKPELPAGYVAWMYDGKEFDFNTPITAEITIVALEAAPIEPTTVYDITFEIADKTPVIQKSDSMVIPDTTLEGYVFQGWVVKNGAQYVDPVEYVKTITENVTFVAVYKLATESAFTVTFEIEGKSPITQKADSLTIPDTTRDGYDFTGWVVKGSSDYVDPLSYAITADITFVAVYKAVEVVEFTVTFVNGDEVVDTVKVVKDALVNEIDAPEGMFWLFDFETPITADITIEAKPLTVTVQFAVGEKVYSAYTQTVAYGEKIDVAKLADFIFPEGFDSWDYDFNEPVTANMTVYAKAIPEPEEVPPFFQTTEGKCVAVLIAVAIIALIYAVATNMFGLKDALTSFKVTRVKK